MKTKSQKRKDAQKTAETLKAKKKALRESKAKSVATMATGKKAKSMVPQAKKKK